ncbi:MAG TPA: hypothetical protein VHM19_23235 [Polyangiales bacterium]|jgi:hypothetical protein|nr:hypothetical protein [Polyangiales bacterium]
MRAPDEESDARALVTFLGTFVAVFAVIALTAFALSVLFAWVTCKL